MDKLEIEFRGTMNGWLRNGLGKALVENPLWTWGDGMNRDCYGNPDLNDVVTVAIIAAQARRMAEGEFVRSRGGWEKVRELYRFARGSASWGMDSPILHVVPIQSGWKVKGLDKECCEDSVVAAEVWHTEGQAWAAAWLLTAYGLIEAKNASEIRAIFQA